MNLTERHKVPSLCDGCSNHFSFLAVAWGRELNDTEKTFNKNLIEEGKAEKCLAYERYFNKSFKKKVRTCAEGESI